MVIFLALASRFLFHGLSVAALELFISHVLRISMSKKLFVFLLIAVGFGKESVDYLIDRPELLNELTLVRDGGLLGTSLAILWIIRWWDAPITKRIVVFFLSFIPLTMMSFFYTRLVIPGTVDIWYKHVLDVLSLVCGSLIVTPRVATYLGTKKRD